MSPNSLRWLDLPPRPLKRLEFVLRRWDRTPYMAGQRCRGIGVDCVQFVTAVLDELHGVSTKVPRLRPDSAVHDGRQALPTIKAIRAGFESVVVRDSTIEPGDVIVVRATPFPSGPRRYGHVLIAGWEVGTLFHAASPTGVSKTSLQGLQDVLRVYRDVNKDQWL
jgi:cell wall-associated NlpC family hydrolase